MKKELKDYLHLYLGCEVVIKNHPNATLGAVGTQEGELVIVRWDNDEWSYADVSEIKPILRPLSSMTEEEQKELLTVGENGGIDDLKNICVRKNWEDAAWLLSKHFDLFGLIPAGLAIDSTTLKPTP